MPAKRLSVVVTRRLPEVVETRMKELFDVTLRDPDTPMSREELAAAMRQADVLVPTITDTIDAGLLGLAGEKLKLIANYGSEQGFLDGWANVPTTATEGYVVGLVEGVGEPMWAVFDQSDFTDESGTWSSTGSMKPFARTSKGWLTYTPEYNSATSQTRMAVYLWSPKSADDAQQIRWWDGEQVQYATLRGWWDGEAEQPLLVNGWWDGSDVLPILEGSA